MKGYLLFGKRSCSFRSVFPLRPLTRCCRRNFALPCSILRAVPLAALLAFRTAANATDVSANCVGPEK